MQNSWKGNILPDTIYLNVFSVRCLELAIAIFGIHCQFSILRSIIQSWVCSQFQCFTCCYLTINPSLLGSSAFSGLLSAKLFQKNKQKEVIYDKPDTQQNIAEPTTVYKQLAAVQRLQISNVNYSNGAACVVANHMHVSGKLSNWQKEELHRGLQILYSLYPLWLN